MTEVETQTGDNYATHILLRDPPVSLTTPFAVTTVECIVGGAGCWAPGQCGRTLAVSRRLCMFPASGRVVCVVGVSWCRVRRARVRLLSTLAAVFTQCLIWACSTSHREIWPRGLWMPGSGVGCGRRWGWAGVACGRVVRVIGVSRWLLRLAQVPEACRRGNGRRNYMNDSLRTDVFVRFNPETIACACIYLAARTLEISLPNRPHWFLLFGATENDIQDVCTQILKLYSRTKADLAVLESRVEKQKLQIEEAKAKAKGLLPDGTPQLGNGPEFSPSVKIDSPKEGKSSKLSPTSISALKNAKRKIDGSTKKTSASPFNGVPKGRDRSGSRSRDESYSRSRSRSASPKRKKSKSYSSSSGSKSRSHSRSRSDSPPRKQNHGSYKSSKTHVYGSDYKYSGHKRRSRSRSSSPSYSRTHDSPDSGKYKKRHYYRDRQRERSRSYERVSHRNYDREYPGHSHHRR